MVYGMACPLEDAGEPDCRGTPRPTAIMSMIAGARPGLRLSYRGYTVMPDAMRVKGEDMTERREMNAEQGDFTAGVPDPASHGREHR